MLEDGSVLLNTGAVDIGQGSNTVLTQICAEALQVPVDRVAIASPDTDGSPYNWGTTASRVTYVDRPLGRRRGRARSRSKLKEHAGEMLECGARRPRAAARRQGRRSRACRSKAVSFADISGARALGRRRPDHRHATAGCSTRRRSTPSAPSALGLPFPQIGIFSFSALVVEVEVDEATGQVRVRAAPGRPATSAGRSIPLMASGQIEGAFVQGMGYALIEEMVWDGARLANPTLMDYKIPTMAELPETLRAYLVESDEPSGPFGAKSVGELGINGVAAAIANAIARRDRRAPAPPADDRRARAARLARSAASHEARGLSAAGAAVGARHAYHARDPPETPT